MFSGRDGSVGDAVVEGLFECPPGAGERRALGDLRRQGRVELCERGADDPRVGLREEDGEPPSVRGRARSAGSWGRGGLGLCAAAGAGRRSSGARCSRGSGRRRDSRRLRLVSPANRCAKAHRQESSAITLGSPKRRAGAGRPSSIDGDTTRWSVAESGAHWHASARRASCRRTRPPWRVRHRSRSSVSETALCNSHRRRQERNIGCRSCTEGERAAGQLAGSFPRERLPIGMAKGGTAPFGVVPVGDRQSAPAS